MKEPKAMKEIHDIRLKLYKKWKKMSRKEMIESINKSGEEGWKEIENLRIKKYGKN